MQTPQTRRLPLYRAEFLALVIGLLVVVLLAGTFGFWLRGLAPWSGAGNPPAPLGAVGYDRITHNQSEQGFDVVSYVGAQQIAHNRSEEGFANP